MKKSINSSVNPKMKLLENKLRKMVKEELLKEDPDPVAAKVIREFDSWLGDFSRRVGHHPKALSSIISRYIKTQYRV